MCGKRVAVEADRFAHYVRVSYVFAYRDREIGTANDSQFRIELICQRDCESGHDVAMISASARHHDDTPPQEVVAPLPGLDPAEKFSPGEPEVERLIDISRPH